MVAHKLCTNERDCTNEGYTIERYTIERYQVPVLLLLRRRTTKDPKNLTVSERDDPAYFKKPFKQVRLSFSEIEYFENNILGRKTV